MQISGDVGWRRSANRGVPKAAARVPKGMLSQAVAKALQPSFFFAMFDDDVQEFIPADAMRSRTSMQVLLHLLLVHNQLLVPLLYPSVFKSPVLYHGTSWFCGRLSQ